jgi:hypothetical protein
MTIDSRTQEMQAHFASNFTGVASTQIVWDNVPENDSLDKDNAWVAVFIDPNIANFTSIGASQRVRHEGLFVVQIFTDKDQSSQAANTIAENVAATLEGEQLAGGVIFGESIISRVGVNRGYYQLNVFTSYRYTDIRT